ncbi:HTH-type transcriptional regulator GntR [Gluconacetobacter takamatsuzukensis]|uniref:LacI family DNA-binding transcriptional regulator n=1 Tax=Gluconacetobacter takamatsuzukensis TaxID=1286190 RepID=A0A7W4KGV8_9PROT|nr:LacI family DNA-binding transcriptional regulator [Gluconacetobacter takamatsuzukensis]MBB2206580.1 LacI family DNA-binding transcriptional regulator [Gluconacetobacter takamatsuzukensis]
MAARKPRTSVRGRVTIEEVAAAAGASTISVSRAFRGSARLSPDLRARIENAAAALGYVPDRAASALASARSMNVAVLVPSITNMVFVDMLAGIDAVLSQARYQIIMATTNYCPAEEQRQLHGLLAFRPDGVLLTGIDHLPGTLNLLKAPALPVVHMMELNHQVGSYSVGFSQDEGGAAIARHFVGRGYGRIGFVAAQLDPRTLARGAGFRRALKEAGLDAPYELMVPDRSSIALGATLLDRVLTECPDIEAVFFCNDDLAHGALFRCQRLGIAVPQRLAIAGFNDLPASSWTVPALSTVATPRHEIGRKSAAMLLDLMCGRTPEAARLDLGFTLHARESS